MDITGGCPNASGTSRVQSGVGLPSEYHKHGLERAMEFEPELECTWDEHGMVLEHGIWNSGKDSDKT